jgi:glycosyltransferase involved in cell wall biosynthesis
MPKGIEINGISIITCTFNPDLKVFRRLLSAILNLIIPDDLSVEFVLINNNSTTDINKFLSEFSFNEIELRIFNEPTQGLTYARIRGIKESKYNLIIFFDDDNEPSNDYLSSLISEVLNHPEVGCWGPGEIAVKFIDKDPDDNKLENFKGLFQDRKLQAREIKCDSHWELNPPGTGLCIKKHLLEDYLHGIHSKRYTASDRIGKHLFSGGDVQIIFSLIRNNIPIGIAPSLKLNHLIPKKRQSLKYILKLYFWTSSSNIQVYNEVFWEAPLKVNLHGNIYIIKRILPILINNFKSGNFREALKQISIQLGQINAHFQASNKKMPCLIIFWIWILES